MGGAATPTGLSADQIPASWERKAFPGVGLYVGEMDESGKQQGTGKLFGIDGCLYEGSWVGGHMEGKGRATSADGAVYEGLYRASQRHGDGKLIFANGDAYEGQWSGGFKHGEGSFYWAATGARYTGQFLYGVVHGTGTCTFADGSSYAGEYRDAKRHGRGTYRSSEGNGHAGLTEPSHSPFRLHTLLSLWRVHAPCRCGVQVRSTRGDGRWDASPTRAARRYLRPFDRRAMPSSRRMPPEGLMERDTREWMHAATLARGGGMRRPRRRPT